jgi:hypothetical protein
MVGSRGDAGAGTEAAPAAPADEAATPVSDTVTNTTTTEHVKRAEAAAGAATIEMPLNPSIALAEAGSFREFWTYTGM